MTTNHELTLSPENYGEVLGWVQLIAATCGVFKPSDGKLTVNIWIEQVDDFKGLPAYEYRYKIKRRDK